MKKEYWKLRQPLLLVHYCFTLTWRYWAFSLKLALYERTDEHRKVIFFKDLESFSKFKEKVIQPISACHFRAWSACSTVSSLVLNTPAASSGVKLSCELFILFVPLTVNCDIHLQLPSTTIFLFCCQNNLMWSAVKKRNTVHVMPATKFERDIFWFYFGSILTLFPTSFNQ